MRVVAIILAPGLHSPLTTYWKPHIPSGVVYKNVDTKTFAEIEGRVSMTGEEIPHYDITEDLETVANLPTC